MNSHQNTGELTNKSANWLIIQGKQVVVEKNCLQVIQANWQELDFLHEYESDVVALGSFQGIPLFMVDIGEEVVPERFEAIGLRSLALGLSYDWFGKLSQAWQYALFLRTHRYCGQCGATMTRVDWEMAMHCHSCQHRCYPRISPCIIVAIKHNNQILLAHGRNHQKEMYSTLAGFVESGESLEQAVHREVHEEVGVKVKNLRYFGSQPWPFPHSLMVGFLADYDSGEINVDGVEILDAKWFAYDELPNTPPLFSIAGKLIAETVREIAAN